MARVDHLLVAVADVDASSARWARAGLAPTRGGEHPGGTHNALLRGPEPAYVELIAAHADGTSETARRVRDNPGPLSWAVAVDDMDAARTALRAAGYDVGRVEDGSRVTPTGEWLAWRTCALGPYAVHDYLPFLIEWATPMPPGPPGGPRLRTVTFEVPEPAALAALLAVVGLTPVPDAPEVTVSDGRVDVRIRPGGGRLVGVGLVGVGQGPGLLDLDGLAVAVLGDEVASDR